jgi:phosphodiesterase/alkaline phosphatase D-like protein
MRILVLALILVAGCAENGVQEWKPPRHKPVNPVVLDLGVEDETAFPAGVIAGDPGPGSMLLWTRALATGEVRLKVWIPDIDPQEPDKVDLLYDQPVSVADGGYVHQAVDAVVPGMRHGYAFFTASARSRVGYFTAAPPEDALVRMTFSGTHGTHQDYVPYLPLVKTAELEPFTLYLHLGDAVYADGADTLEDFRTMWQENWQTDGFKAVLEDTVYLPVWDDHEVENDFNLEDTDPVRIQRGLAAFFESNPINSLPGAPLQLWRSWKWGKKQMAWLKQALLDSDAVFKLILDSAPIIDMPEIWLNTYDRWEGYTIQRQELIDFILDNTIQNIYFITGDFHMAMVGRLDPPGGAGDVLWEFIVGPGAQSNPLGNREAILEETNGVVDPLPPDQFLWGSPNPTITYVDLDPLAKPPRMTLRYHDGDGSPLFTVVFRGGQPEVQ